MYIRGAETQALRIYLFSERFLISSVDLRTPIRCPFYCIFLRLKLKMNSYI
nr:MAG TPA: hypothetical protein [Caudoviricetes sp.]